MSGPRIAGRHWGDWGVGLYSISQAVVGVLAVTGLTAHGCIEQQTPYEIAYGVTLLITGLIAAYGVVTRQRAATAWVVSIGMATAACVQGALLTEVDLAAGVRLLIAPLIMSPAIWGWAYWLEVQDHDAH